MRTYRRISERCRLVITHAKQPLGELVLRRPFGAATSYRWAVPVQDVAARDIAAGDLVANDERDEEVLGRSDPSSRHGNPPVRTQVCACTIMWSLSPTAHPD